MGFVTARSRVPTQFLLIARRRFARVGGRWREGRVQQGLTHHDASLIPARRGLNETIALSRASLVWPQRPGGSPGTRGYRVAVPRRCRGEERIANYDFARTRRGNDSCTQLPVPGALSRRNTALRGRGHRAPRRISPATPRNTISATFDVPRVP